MTALAYVLIVVATGELNAAVERRHSRTPRPISATSLRTRAASFFDAHS